MISASAQGTRPLPVSPAPDRSGPIPTAWDTSRGSWNGAAEPDADQGNINGALSTASICITRTRRSTGHALVGFGYAAASRLAWPGGRAGNGLALAPYPAIGWSGRSHQAPGGARLVAGVGVV